MELVREPPPSPSPGASPAPAPPPGSARYRAAVFAVKDVAVPPITARWRLPDDRLAFLLFPFKEKLDVVVRRQPTGPQRIERRALSGDIKILYVAPERLRSLEFVVLLKRARASLVVLDEAAVEDDGLAVVVEGDGFAVAANAPTGAARRLAERNRLAEIDAQNKFPRELWPEMGALGLHGITVEEEYGGAGLGYAAAPDGRNLPWHTDSRRVRPDLF